MPAPPKRDELELLRAVVDGEAQAWNEFFTRYHRLMVACIRKVLVRYGVPCLPHDIEDMLSNVCVELLRDDFKKLRAFDPERGYKVSSWVGLIATNAAHDALRRRGPATASIDDEELRSGELPDEGLSPADAAVLREQQEILNDAVRELSPGEQTFLRYYYQEGYEPQEIADLLGISINTVYSRKNKVRASLRRIIDRMKNA